MARILRQNALNNCVNSAKKSILNIIYENRFTFCLTVIILLCGAAAGAVTYRLYGDNTANPIFTYIQNYFMGSVLIGISSGEVMKSVMIDSLKITMIVFIAGLNLYLSPLGFVRIFSKGFSVGMTIAFFITRYMVKGLVFTISSVFICNVITIPAIILTVTAQTGACLKLRRQHRDNKNNLLSIILRSLIMSGIMLAALFASALIQSFICPGLMKIFYSIISG